jgi:hypothetical protein
MRETHRRESKLKFTSQVQQNSWKSMDARDQRDRQQFHEAKKFDAVQAPVFTGAIDAALLRAYRKYRDRPTEKCQRLLRRTIARLPASRGK